MQFTMSMFCAACDNMYCRCPRRVFFIYCNCLSNVFYLQGGSSPSQLPFLGLSVQFSSVQFLILFHVNVNFHIILHSLCSVQPNTAARAITKGVLHIFIFKKKSILCPVNLVITLIRHHDSSKLTCHFRL